MPASPDCHVVDRHFRLSDAFWERFRPLLPPERPQPRGGRPRFDARRCLEAILYLLRTGIQWKALPRCMGAPSTVHDRFQEWRAAGVFGDAWREALRTYDSEVGLAWRWQSLDGGMNKAPLGGPATGPNPTDRGKRGVKRSILTDAEGIPLAAVIAPANRHDSKLLEPTLEARVLLPPVTSQNLCLDKGYDFPFCRAIAGDFQFTPHIRPIGEEPRRMERNRKRKARRWVVERTLGWLNRCRRLLIRWEKKAENHLAFLSLACIWIIHRAIARSWGSSGAL